MINNLSREVLKCHEHRNKESKSHTTRIKVFKFPKSVKQKTMFYFFHKHDEKRKNECDILNSFIIVEKTIH